MNNFRRLAVDSFFSGLSELSLGLLFLLFIVAARMLGDTQFGVFSFGLAYVGMFSVINDCGLRYVYMTEVSRDSSLASKYFGNILSLQICLSLIGLTLIYISISFFDKSAETRMVVYLLAGAEIMRSMKFLFRFAFRVSNRFELESMTVSFERLGLLISGITFLSLGFGVIWLAGTFVTVRILDFMMTLFLSKKVIPLNLAFDFSSWLTFMRQGLPFALAGVVFHLLLRIDTVMISIIKSDAEVGWYNAGYKLIEGAALIPAILVNSLLPSVSRLRGQVDEISALYQRAIRYILLIAIPLASIGFILADQLIIFVFGVEYFQSIIVFKILLLSLIFTFAQHIGSPVLQGIGRQKNGFYIGCAVLVINVSLNLILIPIKGYVGAAIATVISELVFCVLCGWFLFSLGYKATWFKSAQMPILASLIVSIPILFFSASLGSTILFSVVGYFGAITLLNYWDTEEIVLAKKMVHSVHEFLQGRI